MILYDRFSSVVARWPDRTAIVHGANEVSYAGVAHLVDDCARTLSQAGIREGDLVALRLGPSIDFVVAVLAVLKRGAAYLPLNPGDPDRRTREILDDSMASILLDADGARRLAGDAPLAVGRDEPGDSPAYVMYTSGSTGRPKGVVVPHRAVERLVVGSSWIELGVDVRTILVSPLAFDASTFELWAPLLNGGLVVVPESGSLSLGSLAAEIERHQVSQLWLPAGLFSMMVDHHLSSLRGVRDLIAGGDVLSPRHVERAARALDNGSVVNGYGPTENTTFSTTYRVRPDEVFDGAVPIGRAVDGTYTMVLDAGLQPVDRGAPGQLAVGGRGLALGYLHDPRLTAERFVPDPTGCEGARVYLTGDTVRLQEDGNLRFVGRADGQVKVRGNRVECAEVEAALLRDRRIRQALVVPETGPSGGSLAAYVVPAADRLEPREVETTLATSVPDFMVPRSIVVVDRFPLTTSGKIDRKALCAGDHRPQHAGMGFELPRDELERRLVNVYQRALGGGPLGADAGFFDSGGDSLAALELIETIQLLFGTALESRVLVTHDTPRLLAQLIRAEAGERLRSPLVPIQPEGDRPPFFCVHGGGGEVLFLTEIRRHLSRHQPFFALSPPGLNSESPILTNVGEYADLYAHAIREFRPVGPYFLGGLCFGGNIALEVGRRLLQSGADVPTVVLFDTIYPGRLRVGQAIVREVAGTWWRAARRRARGDPTSLWRSPIGSVEWAILGAVARYRPQPYPGRVAAFLGDGQVFRRGWDPRLGWADVARGGLDVRHVGGVRSKMFGRRHAADLARTLEAYLAMSVAPVSSDRERGLGGSAPPEEDPPLRAR